MSTHDRPPARVVDRGVTDVLDPLLGTRLARARALVDKNAGIRVDDHGVHLRRVLRTQSIRWEHVQRVVLENRLDHGLAYATRLLPVRRVPLLGDVVRDGTAWAVEQATKRLVPGVRERAGWVVATFEQAGLLHRDVDVGSGASLTALLHRSVSETVEWHATARGIPVVRT